MDEINITKFHIKRSIEAFSLLELMFALVAISIMLAAFAPVVSNRFSSETEMVFNEGELITSEECGDNYPCNIKKPDGTPYLECTLCYRTNGCVTCGGTCPAGKTKNTRKCQCE